MVIRPGSDMGKVYPITEGYKRLSKICNDIHKIHLKYKKVKSVAVSRALKLHVLNIFIKITLNIPNFFKSASFTILVLLAYKGKE